MEYVLHANIRRYFGVWSKNSNLIWNGCKKYWYFEVFCRFATFWINFNLSNAKSEIVIYTKASISMWKLVPVVVIFHNFFYQSCQRLIWAKQLFKNKKWEHIPYLIPQHSAGGWNPWVWMTWFSTHATAFSEIPNPSPYPFPEPDSTGKCKPANVLVLRNGQTRVWVEMLRLGEVCERLLQAGLNQTLIPFLKIGKCRYRLLRQYLE